MTVDHDIQIQEYFEHIRWNADGTPTVEVLTALNLAFVIDEICRET